MGYHCPEVGIIYSTTPFVGCRPIGDDDELHERSGDEASSDSVPDLPPATSGRDKRGGGNRPGL